MNKVLEFPKSRIVREVPVDIEEIEKAKERGLTSYADGIVEDLVGNIYTELENYGLDIENEHFEKDFSFAMDGIRSTVYRILGIEHHLHDFVDNSVKMMKREDMKKAKKNSEGIDVSDVEPGND